MAHSTTVARPETVYPSAVALHAGGKRYVPASHRFGGRPKLKTMRRDEFTLEEDRKLRRSRPKTKR